MKIQRATCAALLLWIIGIAPTFAQTPVAGVVKNRSTINSSVTIATGNTFQQVLPSIVGSSSAQRQSLTVQNNNTSTDNCWLYLGTTANATEAKAIILGPGQAYTRYWPFVPSDAIQVTCATSSDVMYVDNQ